MALAAISKEGFDVAGKKVVAQFMGNGEPLESFPCESGAVQDSESVPDLHETARYSRAEARFFLTKNILAIRHAKRVHRQRRNVEFFQDFMSLQFGTEPVIAFQHSSFLLF